MHISAVRTRFILILLLIVLIGTSMLPASAATSHSSDFRIVDGVLKQYLGKAAEVVVPNGVKAIGGQAFAWCDTVVTIKLPASVTEIGFNAFSECSRLENINLTDRITSIRNGAFVNCKRLVSITLPATVTAIGSDMFLGCEKLERVEMRGALTSIGFGAFNGCHALKRFTIPKTVSSIGEQAFMDCNQLEAILVESGNAHFVSENGILYDMGKTILLQYPTGHLQTRYELPNTVTSLPWGAFHMPKHLQELQVAAGSSYRSHEGKALCLGKELIQYATASPDGTFEVPASIRTLHELAFRNAQQLQTIVLPEGMTSIPKGAFASCTALRKVFLPQSLTTIGDGAFYGCTRIREVDLPASVTTLGASAFELCTSLQRMILPVGLNRVVTRAPDGYPIEKGTIGGNVFQGCTALQAVYVPDKAGVSLDSEYYTSSGMKDPNLLFTGSPQVKVYGSASGIAPKLAAHEGVPFVSGLPPVLTVTAVRNTARVLVNAVDVPFEAYTIDGNNYMKLRDVAAALEGSPISFEVQWDGSAIQLSSGKPYTRQGGELVSSESTAPIQATAGSTLVYLDGRKLYLSAYQIRGNNYFRLRDLGMALGFDVTWDEVAKCVKMGWGE